MKILVKSTDYLEGIIHSVMNDYSENERNIENGEVILNIKESGNHFEVELSVKSGEEKYQNADGFPYNEPIHTEESFPVLKTEKIKKIKSRVWDALDIITTLIEK